MSKFHQLSSILRVETVPEVSDVVSLCLYFLCLFFVFLFLFSFSFSLLLPLLCLFLFPFCLSFPVLLSLSLVILLLFLFSFFFFSSSHLVSSCLHSCFNDSIILMSFQAVELWESGLASDSRGEDSWLWTAKEVKQILGEHCAVCKTGNNRSLSVNHVVQDFALIYHRKRSETSTLCKKNDETSVLYHFILVLLPLLTGNYHKDSTLSLSLST